MAHQNGTRRSDILRRVAAVSAVIACLGASAGVRAHVQVCTGELTGVQEKRVTYTAFVVTDVSLGGRKFHNAQVTLTFKGNSKDVRSFQTSAPDNNTAAGQCIDKGNASVLIVSGRTRITAKFEADQLLVAFDAQNAGIGFSSYTGPNGFEPVYPLGMLDSIVFNFGTINQNTSDLLTPANSSGYAWSCIGYPPSIVASGFCTDPSAYPLKTDWGDFLIYMPYVVVDPSNGGIACDFHCSLNRGIFSTAVGTADE